MSHKQVEMIETSGVEGEIVKVMYEPLNKTAIVETLDSKTGVKKVYRAFFDNCEILAFWGHVRTPQAFFNRYIKTAKFVQLSEVPEIETRVYTGKYPSQETLKSVLNYDPVKGKLYWKRTGKEAGWRINTVDANDYKIKLNGETFDAKTIAYIYIYGSLPHFGRVFPLDGDFTNIKQDNLTHGYLFQRINGTSTNNNSGTRNISWHKTDKIWSLQLRFAGESFALMASKSYDELHKLLMKEIVDMNLTIL